MNLVLVILVCLVIPIDGQTTEDHPDCGKTVHTGSNGFVKSPNWPDFYRNNQNCSNIIWAGQQSTIVLYFHSFNLQDNCSRDWLEISCHDNSKFGPTRYCGNYSSHELYIYRCGSVRLLFHSDDSSNAQGFNIEYKIYPAGDCGDLSRYGPSGVISSPNYPGNYYNFLYCDYTIYVLTGRSIMFVFEPISTQFEVDLVTISCPADSPFLKYEFSGDYPPTPIWFPECSQGLVNFQTDETVVSTGFTLTYYVNDGGCGNTLHSSSSGYVASPNWPSNYGHNQNCSNIIWAPQSSTFYLSFQSFNLQSCCSCDWLEISCVDNSNYGPARYCGSNPPVSTYIYNCSQVLLWFHSDGSTNDQGFNMEYNYYSNADGRKVSINGKRNPAENVPSNGALNADEFEPGKGKSNAEENVPDSGKPNAEERS